MIRCPFISHRRVRNDHRSLCETTVENPCRSARNELATTEGDQLFDNSAKELWENGGRENEILAALPTETAEDGEKVFWGWLSAEFNNEQWIKCD